MSTNNENLKNELIEYYGEEDINKFIEVFGEKILTHYDEIKHKVLKCNVEYQVLKDFIDNFSIHDLELFSDSFQGIYEDFLSFAREIFNDTYLYKIPEAIKYYIDYQKYANDLQYDFVFCDKSGAVFNKNI